MSEVDEIFKYYTERTSGSNIENKKASITWHYRASDPDFGSFQCKQCHDLLESTLVPRRPIEGESGIHSPSLLSGEGLLADLPARFLSVLVGKKNLEVRPLAINKGEIVKKIIYENADADFVFCAGDDKTDEDMFRSLRSILPLTTASASSTDPAAAKNIMSAPIAVTSTCTAEEREKLGDVEVKLEAEGIFSTAVGPSAKKTLARWHVTSPEEVVQMMATLVAK